VTISKRIDRLGWEFLTKTVNLPATGMIVTVHQTDDEHLRSGVTGPQEPNLRLGDETNFWAMDPPSLRPVLGNSSGTAEKSGAAGNRTAARLRCDAIWKSGITSYPFDRSADGKLNPCPARTSIPVWPGAFKPAPSGVTSPFGLDTFQSFFNRFRFEWPSAAPPSLSHRSQNWKRGTTDR